MRLKHHHARQPAHPVDVREPAGLSLHGSQAAELNLVCHLDAFTISRARLRWRRSALRPIGTQMSATRQLAPLPVLGLWSGLCFAGGLYATWHGYGGRGFAATFTTFSVYFGVMLLFAARGVPEFPSVRFGTGAAYLLSATVLIAYLIYAIGTNTFAFSRLAAVLAFLLIPLALAATAKGRAPGSWQDYVIIGGIWVAVKFSPSHWLWPFPGGQLAYFFTVLFGVKVGLMSFMLVRKLTGTASTYGWGCRLS